MELRRGGGGLTAVLGSRIEQKYSAIHAEHYGMPAQVPRGITHESADIQWSMAFDP